jgi:hypothetical protein
MNRSAFECAGQAICIRPVAFDPNEKPGRVRVIARPLRFSSGMPLASNLAAILLLLLGYVLGVLVSADKFASIVNVYLREVSP